MSPRRSATPAGPQTQARFPYSARRPPPRIRWSSCSASPSEILSRLMLSRVVGILLLSSFVAIAQNDRDFSGRWVFQPAQSELRSLPHPPDQLVTIDQQ